MIMEVRLQRASGLGEGGVLFRSSWRSSWCARDGGSVPNLVGRSLASVQSWRRSATGTAATGLARAGRGVRGGVRVTQRRTEATGGLGEAGIDGGDGVLCVLVDGVHAVNGVLARRGRELVRVVQR